jgi:hypothetical protein
MSVFQMISADVTISPAPQAVRQPTHTKTRASANSD